MNKKRIIIALIILAIGLITFGLWRNKGINSSKHEIKTSNEKTITNSLKIVAIERKNDINDLTKLIKDYDDAWISFVNKKDESVLCYVKEGSKLFSTVKNFKNNGYTEELLEADVRGVNFEGSDKAFVKVFEYLGKKSKDKETYVQYQWIYEANKINNKWVLTDCVKSNELISWSIFKLIVINDKEYLSDNWVYFSNEQDNNKLYKADYTNGNITKMNDKPSNIIDFYAGKIYFIDRTNTDDIYEFDTANNSATVVKNVFAENGWRYFNDFVSIYKVNNDGTIYKKIYNRPESGSDMQITKVIDGWIYFSVWSEEGLSENRIKTDGTQFENLKHSRLD